MRIISIHLNLDPLTIKRTLEAAQSLIKGSETQEQQLTLMEDCLRLLLSLLPLARAVEDGFVGV
jgi:hypothetical protein